MATESFDDMIKKELHDAADGLAPSAGCKAAIDRRVRAASRDERGVIPMKRKNLVRAAAAAVAVIALGGTTAYAVTHSGGMYAYGTPNEYTEYAELADAESKADLVTHLPETLAGGYSFDSASVDTFGDLDEDGNRITSFSGISVNYLDADGNRLNVNVEPDLEREIGKDATEVRVLGGSVSVYYSEDEYLFLTPDSEASEEDLSREQTDPHFEISVGSSEDERLIFRGVSFVYDGCKYYIFSSSPIDDEHIAVDTLYEIAADIIGD